MSYSVSLVISWPYLVPRVIAHGYYDDFEINNKALY